MSPLNWGVDSAAIADEELLSCVKNNYGMPDFWGRYLSTVPGASEGLTTNEINFLKSNGIKIMPIYNNFRNTVGKQQGIVAARNAIYRAKRLGIKDGTVLFANIERFFEVDANWLIGWVETMFSSTYRPGYYHDPVQGNFNEAYCQAVAQSELVKNQSILWSAEPQTGVSSKTKIPRFRPQKPDCYATVWAWQYGRNSTECPIDTVLADQKLYNLMY
ncbi:glycoside hydrolase domain-containing protein [Bacillus litorisediminis]|uniref:glycoside hydrolase domain-containing protein n=1 Tax=Bacillus litorisediminis TaxID=2922713 RepID=UPI001FADD1B2|nr:glycoside hydrolase domain-containing protein [Bacillus litorisediminis]